MKPDLNDDISSPQFKADPFGYYRMLRATEPVHLVKLPDGQQAWLVTRYDDVVTVLKDERFAKDRMRVLSAQQLAAQPWVPKAFMPLAHNMLDQDPPDHTRLRELVHKAFTPRMVEAMRDRMQRLADELLDAAETHGRTDLIRDYALPIPTTIIAEMLGVDPHDRHKFHRWTSALVSADYSKLGIVRMVPSFLGLRRYVKDVVARRRAKPDDDLVSALVQAKEAGDQLSEDELVAMVFLLIIAGHETTVNLIGNGALALMRHPEQMERLRDDPALMKTAVEEMLRYEGPLETATERFAREDIRVAGTTIPAGSLVLAVLASANRDERQFPRADALDLSRADNKHVAFGFGIHYCVGAPLARLEAQIAISRLLARCGDLKLAIAPERLRWKRGMILRGLESLPVNLEK